MITKLPRIVIGVSKRFKGVKKLKAFDKPKVESYQAPLKYDAKTKSIYINKKRELSLKSNIARQDKAAKVGRIVEERSLREGLRRIRSKSLSIFGTKGHYEKVPGTNFKRISAKGKRAKAAFTKASDKVKKISERKGLRAYDKASTKLGVGKRRYGVSKPKAIFTSDAERKMTGMPPVEYTAEMKSFHGVRPAEMLKRHRKTLSTIYSKPKSWKKRKQLITHYRNVSKIELKQAKIDRNLFRDQSVQKITKEKDIWIKGGYVSKPRKVTRITTKNFRSPEKVYDVTTKRWKRTRIF